MTLSDLDPALVFSCLSLLVAVGSVLVSHRMLEESRYKRLPHVTITLEEAFPQRDGYFFVVKNAGAGVARHIYIAPSDEGNVEFLIKHDDGREERLKTNDLPFAYIYSLNPGEGLRTYAGVLDKGDMAAFDVKYEAYVPGPDNDIHVTPVSDRFELHAVTYRKQRLLK